jgi:hypothetical protein
MVTKYEKDLYKKVNAAWPTDVPALTSGEATRAARRLYSVFCGRRFTGLIKVTGGNRYGGIRNGVMSVNPDKGWKNMVHILSHYFNHEPHGEGHALFEKRMIEYVVNKGWLTGKLKTEDKPKLDIRLVRAKRIEQRLIEWERRAKRANTALKKLRRQMKYYEQELRV